MDRPSRIRRGVHPVRMWARGFGARGVHRGVVRLAVQLARRWHVGASWRGYAGETARRYAERLRGRFTLD